MKPYKQFHSLVRLSVLVAIVTASLAIISTPSQAGNTQHPSLNHVVGLIWAQAPNAPDAPPAPTFSQAGGLYTDPVSLSVVVTDTSTIRFTLDGSEPVSTSVVYTQPLLLVNRSSEPNAISNITTTGPGYWTPPDGNVFKGTVVRAAGFAADGSRGPVTTQSYFIGADVFTRYAPLPIVSLSTAPGNFFSPISDSVSGGIYVLGDAGANDTNYPFFNANFWTDWERPLHLEYYLPNGQLAFQQGIGAQVSGGFSRGHNIKSINLYARNSYGKNSVTYPLFPERPYSSYQRLVLRASGNDYDGAYMRDDVLTSLLVNSDQSVGAGKPVIVFINGEYWGIFHLRERTNQFYLANQFGIDRNKVDLLQYDTSDATRGIVQPTVDEGSSAGWNDLLDYFATHEMTDTASYAYVQTQMDIDNFAGYFAAQIYYNNRDWPANNNRFWRTNDPIGKWRWLVWDVEYGYGTGENNAVASPNYNMLLTALGEQSDFANAPFSTLMFRKLIQNEDFRNRFLVRAADQMNLYFTAANVNARIDQYASQLGPLMPEHIKRWGYPIDLPKWQEHVAAMRSFADQRVGFYRQHLQNRFGLSGMFTLSLSTDASKGSVRTTSLNLSGTITSANVPWTGEYFDNVPLQLSAIPKGGFRFDRWVMTPTVVTNQPVGASQVFSNEIVVLTNQNVAYEAVFVSDSTPTSTPTPTPTATATPTTTVTPSATPTITVTPGPTSTGTAVPSQTATPSSTATPVVTPARSLVAWDLHTGPYTLTTWLSNTKALSYPVSMEFRTVSTRTTSPDPSITITMDSPWTLPYSLTSRSRVNGLDAQGIGFINTDNANTGAGFVGTAVLALNTSNLISGSVWFSGGTVLSNTIVYGLRLQYRITNTVAFTDVLSGGAPVEYLRSDVSGDAQAFGPIRLPDSMMNKPYVELQWKYHCVSGCGGSGRRAQLRLDDILVLGQGPFRSWLPFVIR
jgi:hypothetical protein